MVRIAGDLGNIRTFYTQTDDRLFHPTKAFGGAAADIIYGDNGQDIIFGDFGYYNAETEILPNQFYTSISEHFAAAGNDAIYGGNGDDFLYGQEVSTQFNMQEDASNHCLQNLVSSLFHFEGKRLYRRREWTR